MVMHIMMIIIYNYIFLIFNFLYTLLLLLLLLFLSLLLLVLFTYYYVSAAGMDYTAVSHNFTYAPGADLTCFAYDALMDSVYEEKEDYFLQFVSNDPSVIINQDGRLSVFILDSTSKMVMAQNNNSIPVQVK